MTEPTFIIRINPDTTYIQRNRLYQLKTQKTSRILNGNKFMFNEVIKQIQKEKRKADYQKNLQILNLLLS